MRKLNKNLCFVVSLSLSILSCHKSINRDMLPKNVYKFDVYMKESLLDSDNSYFGGGDFDFDTLQSIDSVQYNNENTDKLINSNDMTGFKQFYYQRKMNMKKLTKQGIYFRNCSETANNIIKLYQSLIEHETQYKNKGNLENNIKPLYIIEIGCGTGKFAIHLIDHIIKNFKDLERLIHYYMLEASGTFIKNYEQIINTKNLSDRITPVQIDITDEKAINEFSKTLKDDAFLICLHNELLDALPITKTMKYRDKTYISYIYKDNDKNIGTEFIAPILSDSNNNQFVAQVPSNSNNNQENKPAISNNNLLPMVFIEFPFETVTSSFVNLFSNKKGFIISRDYGFNSSEFQHSRDNWLYAGSYANISNLYFISLIFGDKDINRLLNQKTEYRALQYLLRSDLFSHTQNQIKKIAEKRKIVDNTFDQEKGALENYILTLFIHTFTRHSYDKIEYMDNEKLKKLIISILNLNFGAIIEKHCSDMTNDVDWNQYHETLAKKKFKLISSKKIKNRSFVQFSKKF